MEYGVIYLLGINIITFLLYRCDKRKAKKKLRRIPEKVLLGFTVAGGSVGALLGMKVYRHKIRKVKFGLGVPLIFFLHFVLLLYFVFLQ